MTDFITTKLTEIKGRLKELEPFVEEHERLKAAYEILTGSVAVNESTRRGPNKIAGNKRGRQPTRANEVTRLVHQNPGITTKTLADLMKINPNYLYRVIPKLQADGILKKEGRGWKIS